MNKLGIITSRRVAAAAAVLLGTGMTQAANAQEPSPGDDIQTECAVPFGGDFPVEQCPSQTASSTTTLLFDFVNSLRTRVAQQRRARRVLDVDEEGNVARGMTLGGAASADEEVSGVSAYGRLSPFFVLDHSEGDRDRTSRGYGYDQDADSFILGADYRFSDTLFAGATLSYLSAETEYDEDQGSIDLDGYILGLHGSKYFANNLFVDAVATYGELETDILRRAPPSQRFTASPDGDVFSGELALGYQYSQGRTRLTPLVRFHYLDGSLDSYSETVASGFGPPNSYDEQEFDAENLEISFQADTVLLMDWGVLIPSVNVAYHHEFSDATVVRGNYFDPEGPAFAQQPDDPDRNTVVVRLGASAQFTHGWSSFVSLEKLLQHDYFDRYHAVLGVRYEIF